jgi:hypothetical protein
VKAHYFHCRGSVLSDRIFFLIDSGLDVKYTELEYALFFVTTVKAAVSSIGCSGN